MKCLRMLGLWIKYPWDELSLKWNIHRMNYAWDKVCCNELSLGWNVLALPLNEISMGWKVHGWIISGMKCPEIKYQIYLYRHNIPHHILSQSYFTRIFHPFLGMSCRGMNCPWDEMSWDELSLAWNVLGCFVVEWNIHGMNNTWDELSLEWNIYRMNYAWNKMCCYEMSWDALSLDEISMGCNEMNYPWDEISVGELFFGMKCPGLAYQNISFQRLSQYILPQWYFISSSGWVIVEWIILGIKSRALSLGGISMGLIILGIKLS